MMSFFLNPWTLAAGIGLASTPIIIHLINRMRFRRVKWAAMEFLLKAQKKMRRKKVLEQLLLLLLRVLLVLLAAALVARFLGADPEAGKETRPVLHVVLLDDSASMADAGEGGPGADAFSRGRALVADKLLAAAAKATTPQSVRIVRLSDGKDVLNEDRAPEAVTGGLIDRARGVLAGQKPVGHHVPLAQGLDRAKALLDLAPGNEVAKVVHVVSDLRAPDWGRDAEAIGKAVKELAELGIKVHLIDVAPPNRKPDRKSPSHSDNVGVLDLRPRSRVTALDREVEFELRVKNYGKADLKGVRAEVYVNGKVNRFASVRFESLPPGQEAVRAFEVKFAPEQGATVGTREDPLGRFNVVTARLADTGPDALPGDNARHAVVEVREKMAVLLVTRPEDKPDDKDGDSFHLRRLFEVKFSGIEVVGGTADQLAKLDLRDFASVYLVNVPELKKAEREALERYVRDGGGVGVFLGPNVNATKYNEELYRKGEGFFPFPLPGSPTEPPTPDQKLKRGLFSGSSLTKKVLIRDAAAKAHPALQGIYGEGAGGGDKDSALKVEATFLLVGIDQHWPVARIGGWRTDRNIQELYCLPNEAAPDEFQGRINDLAESIRKRYGEPKFEKYRATVDGLLAKLRATSAAGSDETLAKLAQELDKLLSDQVTEGDATEALLREFWGHAEFAEIKATAQGLRDSAKYGDPLYVARRFGGGRVGVFTVDAGAKHLSGRWTDWPDGPGGPGWVVVMTELQKYLGAGGVDENRAVNAPLEFLYEADRYDSKAEWSFRSFDAAKPDVTQNLPPDPKPEERPEPKPVTLVSRDGGGLKLRLNEADTLRPGAYLFALKRKVGDPPDAAGTKPEYAAAVVNFDTEREGDLKRANTDEFKAVAKGAEAVHSPEDDAWLNTLEQKPTDLSSGRWIYLVILLVLIFEQAWAVKLSYHGRPDELETFAPTAAAAMAARTAAPVAADDAPRA
ncbi:MAG: hypothetical protein C0501_11455 [Isosphaera sp.]|nr:hypothetical protein [Isosphaera sp.]